MMNSNASSFDPHRRGYVPNPYDPAPYYDASVGYRGPPGPPQLPPPQLQPPQHFHAENPYAVYDPGMGNGVYPPAPPPVMPGSEAMYYNQQMQPPDGLNASAAAFVVGGTSWNGAGSPGAAVVSPQDPEMLAMSTEPGYYYPSAAPIVPQWGSAPITSLAYDDQRKAIYAASTTISSGRPPSTRMKCQPEEINFDRSAMLATHSTNPVDSGMLYASVAGHPEASRNTLMDVYSCLYGFIGIKKESPTAKNGRSGHIPSHAYKPVYGRTNSSTPGMDLAAAMTRGAFAAGKNTFHMGINTLVPLSGHVASVSPAAVRVHAHGGLQLADQTMEGMLCGTVHPNPAIDTTQAPPSHIAVGGVMHDSNQRHQLHCLDVWQGLKVVTSRQVVDSDHDSSLPLGVTALATSHKKGSVVAGCSDGKIRFLDGNLREVAKIRGHASSVNNVAVSEDGMLVATTGYGYRPAGSKSLYAFPDPNILLFDIRYLGRGGISHPFSGLNGGPRFVSFIPALPGGQSSNRILAASGQSGGGMQIIVPFEPSQNDIPANFMLPQLERGESVSAMVVSEDNLALGTSQCRILQYKMSAYTSTVQPRSSGTTGYRDDFTPASPTRSPGATKTMLRSPPKPKEPLQAPPFVPPPPALSIDISVLQSDNPNIRNGVNDRIKSIFTAYTLLGEPKLSPLSTFGPLAKQVMLPTEKRTISSQLTSKAEKSDGDYLMTIPTSSLELDLLQNHSDTKQKAGRQKHRTGTRANSEPLPNPNKTIYCKKIASMCYEPLHSRRHIADDKSGKKGAGALFQDENSKKGVPPRYRLTVRPSYKSGATFDHAEFNHTGLFPGWDYPPSMPNAFVSPVLLLMYFDPTLRSAVCTHQFDSRLLASRSISMIPELSFLFHQMESLSRSAHSYATDFPKEGPRIRAWVPTSFLASLTSTPEAQQLQILDGSPAAVDLPRRAEAFYLYLLYQIDKELLKIDESKVLDSMYGTDFVSVNEFITGKGEATQSTSRALTVELGYDSFREETKPVRFGQVLQGALCKDTRLRAWNQMSRSFETIVQRKIATSLPRVLSISCACAGRKEEDGLKRWRTTMGAEDHWLPELIEVELSDGGGVVVKQCGQTREDDEYEWETFAESSKIPETVSKLVMEQRELSTNRKYRYRLDAVVSFIRDDVDSTEESPSEEESGHHVVHVRVPKQYKQFLLSEQRKELDSLANTDWANSNLFVKGKDWDQTKFRQRADQIQESLDALQSDESSADSSWILANGYVVSDTVIEDARAFHVPFKEPCLVVYRAMDSDSSEETDGDESFEVKGLQPSSILSRPLPVEIMNTRSITNGCAPKYPVDLTSLPGEGDLVAFDAEFVSVQEEVSRLTKSGSKVTVRELRHAVARISVIDCKKRKVIIDDHVLPQERVVDYLTRFSGIVARDLDPIQSPHHLISSRSAYLKLRLLLDRGCIFVGHGLCQDFLMVNLVVPNRQKIDTVDIFHQDRMRYISLRFLTNYILGRDMQRDTHDSVEDALAAYEVYAKGLELKKNGHFERALSDLYEHGRKTDWKLGVAARER